MVGTGSYTGLVAEPSACRTEVPSVVSVLTTVIFILVAQFGFEPVHRLCYLGECLPSLGLGFFCLSARCRKPLSVPSMLLLELSPDKMLPHWRHDMVSLPHMAGQLQVPPSVPGDSLGEAAVLVTVLVAMTKGPEDG